MKKYFLLLFIVPAFTFAQIDSDTIPSNNWDLQWNVFFDLNINQSFPLGEHFLNKAYEPNVGWDIFLNVLEINGIQLGGGFGRFTSNLTDPSLAGNFKSVAYRTLYAKLAYEFLSTEHFKSNISLGYGENYFKQVTSNVREGNYTTGEFRLGTSITYIFSKQIGVQAGVNYLTTNKSTSTSQLTAANFGRLDIIQVFIGFRFYLSSIKPRFSLQHFF